MEQLLNLVNFLFDLYRASFIDSRAFVIFCFILLASSLPISYLIEPLRDYLILTKPEAYDKYLERLVNLIPLLPLLIFLSIFCWRTYLWKFFIS